MSASGMRRVAILGAAGFIGGRATEMLHCSGEAAVRPIVRRPASGATGGGLPLQAEVADAADPAALARAIAGCDGVVAATAGAPADIVGVIEPIYRACAETGVRRLVYLSSASVHGQSPPAGVDEDTPLTTDQPLAYNAAKVRAEARLRELSADSKVEVVVLRPGIVYGPRSQWTDGWADELLSGAAYVVDGARGACNAIYVDDVVDAIALALTKDAAAGRTYLLGNGEQVSWRDLLAPVAEALGLDFDRLPDLPFETAQAETAPRPDPPRPSGALRLARRLAPGRLRAMLRGRRAGADAPPADPRPTLERALLHTARHKPSWDRARVELGYAPSISLREGMQRSLAWLADAGYPTVDRRQP
jgi:nucleoside-diphosphate-sugar epimerase